MVTLCDGACGTMLNGGENIPADLWCERDLDRVRLMHARYLSAGSRVIRTDTFNALRLGNLSLLDKAWEAVRRLQGEVWWSLWPGAKHPAVIEHILSLTSGRCHIHLETASDKERTRDVIMSLCPFRDEVVISVSAYLTGEGCLSDGTPLSELCSLCLDMGVEVIGLNCMQPAEMAPFIAQIKSYLPAVKTCAFPSGTERWASEVAKYLLPLNVDYIGGCCGTSPDDICDLHKIIVTSLDFKTP